MLLEATVFSRSDTWACTWCPMPPASATSAILAHRYGADPAPSAPLDRPAARRVLLPGLAADQAARRLQELQSPWWVLHHNAGSEFLVLLSPSPIAKIRSKVADLLIAISQETGTAVRFDHQNVLVVDSLPKSMYNEHSWPQFTPGSYINVVAVSFVMGD